MSSRKGSISSIKSTRSEEHTLAPPDQECLSRAAQLPLLDLYGSTVSFESLYRDPSLHGQQRHLIIFIRNFFCGLCQDYLAALCTSITPAALADLHPPVTLSVVGCGSPNLIPFYAKSTDCPFPIYTDSTGNIYSAMHLVRSMRSGPTRPEYQTASISALAVRSLIQGVSTGISGAWHGGDLRQVGGEFIVCDGSIEWAHRMGNTRDHTEVEDLMQVLGLHSERAKA